MEKRLANENLTFQFPVKTKSHDRIEKLFFMRQLRSMGVGEKARALFHFDCGEFLVEIANFEAQKL